MDRVLPPYPPDRSASARRQLERLGVIVRTNTRVTAIDEQSVHVVDAKAGEGAPEEVIPARTVLWAAGVLASSFGRRVAEATGAETDRNGRILVEPDLTVAGHPEIFVVGDAAVQPWKPERAAPGVAQGGFTAWLLWLGIHITYLIGFANRIVVVVRWAGSFLTHGRGTRLITGSQLLPIEEPKPPVIADAADEDVDETEAVIDPAPDAGSVVSGG
jgi:NADH dehydrogenase